MAVTSPTATAITGTEELEQILAAAQAAAGHWGALRPRARADMLDQVAAALDDAADELVPLAAEETHLSQVRLAGELKRTTFQLCLFSEILRHGGYLDVRIDHADPDWPMGAPRPDLRRVYRPLGPIVVFAASNFPFAFSVAGGDTASALAAGNPVILKVHPGHPRLSERTAQIMNDTLLAAGAPEGVFALIFGTDPGRTVLKDPRIKAGSFTGSIPGGRALMEIAVSRPEPIPFYGELGSNNPVFVTPAAAEVRGDQIAEEFINSFTIGAGQFCTKPGMIFVPAGSGMVERLRSAALPDGAKLLNERIQDGYLKILRELKSHEHMQLLVQGPEPLADPPSPTLLRTTSKHILATPRELERECFGPTAVVVEYENILELVPLAKTFEGQLTATIQGEQDSPVAELIEVLAGKAGRVLWNDWPTGVSVTYAQHHGGPYPASTTPATTSVGTAAIERFLRPVAYQNFPQHLLPEALQDANPLKVSRMIDGTN